MGYLTESPYELNVGGHCPYIPSHGAFLAATSMFLVNGSLWDNTVDICTHLPLLLRGQRIRWSQICTPNGVVTNGSYGPTDLEINLDCRSTITLNLAIPYRIAGEPLAVTLDGQAITFDNHIESIQLKIEAGKHFISIARDESTKHDVLVIESLSLGKQVRDIVAERGQSVRWARDFENAIKHLKNTKMIHLHMSYADYPNWVTDPIMDAVRNGATLISQFQSGLRGLHQPMAEFLGVNATIENDWDFTTTDRTFLMTHAGKELFPEIDEALNVPVSTHLIPELATDVEVLAIDETINQPSITRRRVEHGWAYWVSIGDKNANMSKPAQHGLSMVREIYTRGITRPEQSNLKWLDSPDYSKLLQAIISLHIH